MLAYPIQISKGKSTTIATTVDQYRESFKKRLGTKIGTEAFSLGNGNALHTVLGESSRDTIEFIVRTNVQDTIQTFGGLLSITPNAQNRDLGIETSISEGGILTIRVRATILNFLQAFGVDYSIDLN